MIKPLTTKEKIALVTKLEERIKKFKALVDQAAVVGFPTSPICEAAWELESAAVFYAATLVEDQADWLSWYFYERSDSCNLVSLGKWKVNVNTPKDIIKVIEKHAN